MKSMKLRITLLLRWKKENYKYISSFDYFDKSLIVLSVTTDSISIASFETVIGEPVGIASASVSLAFSISTGIVKQEIRIKSTIKLSCYLKPN